MLARVSFDKSVAKSKVSLNVGGRVFTALKDTFLWWKGTYFHALLSSDMWSPDEDGTYFIDRDPELFSRIMATLRSGNPIDHVGLSSDQVQQLRVELDYYQLPAWVSALPTRWHANRCSGCVTISEAGRTASKTVSNRLGSSVLGTTADGPSFQVRLENLAEGDVAIGYAKGSAFRPDNVKVTGFGWFLDCSTGYICGLSCKKQYYCPWLRSDDLVTVLLDKVAQTISFEVNGRNYGIAFWFVASDGPVFPCLKLLHTNSSVSIVD